MSILSLRFFPEDGQVSLSLYSSFSGLNLVSWMPKLRCCDFLAGVRVLHLSSEPPIRSMTLLLDAPPVTSLEASHTSYRIAAKFSSPCSAFQLAEQLPRSMVPRFGLMARLTIDNRLLCSTAHRPASISILAIFFRTDLGTER